MSKQIKKDFSLHEASLLERFSVSATKKVGSIPSLLLHTVAFVGIFSLQFFGFGFDQVLLILTTIVSLEAIYLSIFIQMTVNRHAETLSEVSEDVEDIQEDVEDIQEDVEGIEKEVKEIGDDVEEISEDVEEMAAEESEEEKEKEHHLADMKNIEATLRELLAAVEQMKK